MTETWSYLLFPSLANNSKCVFLLCPFLSFKSNTVTQRHQVQDLYNIIEIWSLKAACSPFILMLQQNILTSNFKISPPLIDPSLELN